MNSLTATEWVLIIGAFGAMITQIITAIRGNTTARETQAEVKKTHEAVNSRMDAVVNATQASSERLLANAVEAAFQAGVKQATDLLAAAKIAALKPEAQKVEVVNEDPIPVDVKKKP